MGARRDPRSAPDDGGSARRGREGQKAAVSVERISGGLDELGIAADDAQIHALHRYMGELALWNRKRDLVKAEGELLVVRHVLDSLAGLETVRGELERTMAARSAGQPGGRTSGQPGGRTSGEPGTPKARLFDLGSGGGFPGIPLAVFLPDVQVTLVERSARKCAFLRGVAAVTGLANIEVMQADYTAIGGAGRESAPEASSGRASSSSGPEGGADVGGADVVVFRALAPIDEELAGNVLQMLRPWGSVVAYKGKYENAVSEADASRRRFSETEVIPVTVPGLDEQRSLLVLRSFRESS